LNLDNFKVIVIFTTKNIIEINRAHQYLEEKGIPSNIKNMNTQDLIGMGKISGNINPVVGEYELEINEKNTVGAVNLLSEIFPDYFTKDKSGSINIEEDTESSYVDEEAIKETAEKTKDNYESKKYELAAVLLSIFWGFGTFSIISLIISILYFKKNKLLFGFIIVLSLLGILAAYLVVLNTFLIRK
jgi:hypothetical protein